MPRLRRTWLKIRKDRLTRTVLLTRPFGKTGHHTSLAIFGSACLHKINQEIAGFAIELALEKGVNTFDTAPGYGDSELLIGGWLEKRGLKLGKGYRPPFFLATKNGERSREKALESLHRSLERLKVEVIDLYQFHAVTSMRELDQITSSEGALQVFMEARKQGLIRFMGITGHGPSAPQVFLEALNRMELDSVLFSVYPRLWADPVYRQQAGQLLSVCQERQIAVMAINATAKGPWGSKHPRYYSWYEPYDSPEQIQEAVDFALSQEVSGYCTIADLTLLLSNLQACERFTPMSLERQQALIERSMVNEELKFFD
jgi:aryl-alcohol dehydrogenase-like predicted oxidoreductase